MLATQIALLSITCLTSASSNAPKQPHILLVVADDYGYNDVGYHQNKASVANPSGADTTTNLILTPIIDQLASEGVKLTNYYVQPLCSPTRGTIMTGRYPSHTGIGPNVIKPTHPYALPKSESTMADTLKAAGYSTHMIGKWHLGFCDERYTPTFRGFDSFLGYLEGAEDYYLHTRSDSGYSGLDFRASSYVSQNELPNATRAYRNTYSAHVFASRAQAVVDQHNASQPLFMYLPFQSVHGPLQAPKDQIRKYSHIASKSRRTYAAMVTTMDDAIASVVSAFKSAGLWQDTVMVFTTDNGGPLGSANNFPLRGHKATAWEGGVHGVAFVRGTDSEVAPLNPERKGSVSGALMHSTDWLPTLSGLATGARFTTEIWQLPLDGVDQWGVIANGNRTERTSVVHNCPAKGAPLRGAFRLGDWKLLIAGQDMQVTAGMVQTAPPDFHPTDDMLCPPPAAINETWLFNIAKDPRECHNLVTTEPEQLQKVMSAFSDYHQTAVPDLALSHGRSDPSANPAKLPGQAWGPFGPGNRCR